tara:strand:- start:5646 stop:8555 length:2910 start_codon:yes stop_codon:yes gene_type:complete
MSVQLIVFPQAYEGVYNVFSSNPQELLIDGLDFNTLNTSPIYTTNFGNAMQDIINTYNSPTSASPTNYLIPNTYYRFTSLSPTPPTPIETGGELILGGIAANTQTSGVIQRLTNLNTQTDYIIRINVTGVTNPNNQTGLEIRTYSTANNFNSFAPIYNLTTGLQQITINTNNHTELILGINYKHIGGGATSSVNIDTVTVLPTFSNADDVTLADGQVILDLYEDEDIPLTLSVDNFKNAAEKVQSYSKAFKLPATKRNTRIFNFIFDITRTTLNTLDFNPYRRTKCIMKENGFILFEGYLRLIEASNKKGETSYNVNLYADVTALKEILADRTLGDLGLSELEHTFDRTNIQNSYNTSGTGIAYTNPNTSGFRDAYTTVKYPFCDWNHQGVKYMPFFPFPTPIPTLFNPRFNNLADTFRPWINMKYIVDRIFSASDMPFGYVSTFFDSDDFKNMYMDFNWGGETTIPSFNQTSEIKQTGTGSSIGVAFPSFGRLGPKDLDLTNNPITISPTSSMPLNTGHDFANAANQYGTFYTAQYDNQIFNIDFSYTFIGNAPPAASSALACRWIHLKVSDLSSNVITEGVNMTDTNFAGEEYFDVSFFSTTPMQWNGSFEIELMQGDIIFAEAGWGGSVPSSTFARHIVTTIDTQMIDASLLSLRGALSQWEFLKGIMTMFNLVSLPSENDSNLINFEPYGDVFITNTASKDASNLSLAGRSIEHDWTDKVDISEMKLSPLEDLTKHTHFKYANDEDDYMLSVYKKSVPNIVTNGHDYGSLLYSVPLANLLEGKTDIVAEPYSATIIKPYMDIYTSLIIPTMYSMTDAGESEGFENAPRIMFNNGVVNITAPSSYYIPQQNNVAGENATSYLQFSHFTDFLPTNSSRDLNFGPCQLVIPGATSPPNNLFTLYWLDYINELYHPDTREMTLKVNLSSSDINLFKFNDKVFIKNRTFRVNKIDYKPNDLSTVEFILIP